MKISFRMNLPQPATVYCSDNLKHAQSYAITWNTESYPPKMGILERIYEQHYIQNCSFNYTSNHLEASNHLKLLSAQKHLILSRYSEKQRDNKLSSACYCLYKRMIVLGVDSKKESPFLKGEPDFSLSSTQKQSDY